EKVNIGDVNGDKTNVDTKILDNSNPSNPGGEDGGYGSEDTVYAIIEGTTTVNEGNEATYTVKLVDKDGNVVTPTKDTTVTVVYKDKTTNDGLDTNKSNGEKITVVIKANETSAEFKVETKDDYLADNGEVYNVSIEKVEDQGQFEKVNIGDVNGDKTNVDTKILDNSNPSNPGGEDGGYGSEDTVYVKIEGNPTVIEGGKLSHTVTLVDKDGNPVTIPAGESVTVTLTYTIKQDGGSSDDYVTKEETITIKGGTSSTTFENITKVDFVTEGKEVYEITISKVEQSGAFENVVIDSIANKVTDTILDGITLTNPQNAHVDEDNFYTNKNDGTNSTTKNSNINDTKSLGFTIPTNYETEVGTFSVNFVNAPTVTVDGNNYALTSNGVAVTYTVNGNTITANAGSTKVFDIV
ncbi:hypothetical protein PZQ46_12270, partial [Aliarcobacter butzleri]